MRSVLAVILLLVAVVATLSSATAEDQSFFYEAKVVGTDGNPLTGRQTFRLKADIDGKEFTSDAVAVEVEANGAVRVPFLIGGGAKDLSKMANVVLTAQWRMPSSGEWVRVGPAQRLGCAVGALVANEAVVLTNDQEIVVSSNLKLDSLKAATLEVEDIRPTSIANPQAIELGDAAGKTTLQCGSVKFVTPPKRILSMCGPFPATNTVMFRSFDAKYFSQVSFVHNDGSPWNSPWGRIYSEFTAPCDCIYEIEMKGAMGSPTGSQQMEWEQLQTIHRCDKVLQQVRVFLGLATRDHKQWRSPFDMAHGWLKEKDIGSIEPVSFDWLNSNDRLEASINARYEASLEACFKASRKWLEGTDPNTEWGKRDNVLQIPLACGETFYTVFFIGPMGVSSSGYCFLPRSWDMHGEYGGAAPGSWIRVSFNYYPLSANR